MDAQSHSSAASAGGLSARHSSHAPMPQWQHAERRSLYSVHRGHLGWLSTKWASTQSAHRLSSQMAQKPRSDEHTSALQHSSQQKGGAPAVQSSHPAIPHTVHGRLSVGAEQRAHVSHRLVSDSPSMVDI